MDESTRLDALSAAISALHTPVEEESEVWADNDTTEALHDERFPDCDPTACDGHSITILVCSECGYTHDGEMPVFRVWPCATMRALA